MSRLRVHCFSVSLDGYGAGPGQGPDLPCGAGGLALHDWIFATRTFRRLHGGTDGATGIDDDFVAHGFEGIGAWIVGRNMFGPIRGAWPDETWRGWWGEAPPFRAPVFVLTHHARPSLRMAGGTVFHFETGGIAAALQRAREAAEGRDVRLGGGISTLRQYLAARLVDHIHLAMTPVLLGAGEALFAGLDLPALGYRLTDRVATASVAHAVIRKES